MASSFRFFFLFSFILFFLQASRSQERCRSGCGGTTRIRFPFQMNSSLPKNRCGYPGFTVVCKNETENILTFPFSGDFRINSISYSSQNILLTDPSNCIARCLLQGFNYSDTPFQPLHTRNFTFLNCTSDAPILSSLAAASPIPCLSSFTERVSDFNTSSCVVMATFLYLHR